MTDKKEREREIRGEAGKQTSKDKVNARVLRQRLELGNITEGRYVTMWIGRF